MGLNNLHLVNLSFLGKLAWYIYQNQSSLLSLVFKQDFHNSKLFQNNKNQGSWGLKSVLEGWNAIDKGLFWVVGNGEDILFWKHNWVYDFNLQSLALVQLSQEELSSKVKD